MEDFSFVTPIPTQKHISVTLFRLGLMRCIVGHIAPLASVALVERRLAFRSEHYCIRLQMARIIRLRSMRFDDNVIARLLRGVTSDANVLCQF